jgi:hypothetical protein
VTRPSFSVSIPGQARYQADETPNGAWQTKADCHFAAETVSGTSRRKPKGWIPPTGYSFSRTEYHRAYGYSYVGIVANNWSKWDGYVGATGRFNSLNHFNSAMTDSTADSVNSALGRASLAAARNRLKNMKVDLGVAFAERKATSNMLGDVARRMARSVRELRRGNFRNGARALGIIHDPGKPRGSNWTNHWLQLQYGWKPLLSDVYGSCDALSKREQSDWRVTSKAQRNDELVTESATYPGGTTYPTSDYDAYHCVARRYRGVFTRIDALPQNDLAMSLTSLGVTNPLLVAWELVPYSFVVDWCLPVGAWLSSLDALLGYGSAYTSTTYYNKTLWEDKGVSRDNFPNPKVAYVKNNWTGTKERLKITRTASSGVPLPAFPSIKDPRSLGHMANGLSLLAQAFGRPR